jgi:hypothetical protein
MNSKRARKYNSSKNNKRDNEDLAIRNKSNQDENYKINNQKTKFLKNYNTRSQKNAEISTATINQENTNASKASIKLFKYWLVSYKTQLNQLKEELQNSSSIKAYEICSEARRKIQLKTEEAIAELKMLNGFNINDDERLLPSETQLEIESIQKKNDSLIEKTESYEQTLISESESSETKSKVNKILAELNKKIKVVDHFNKLIDSDSLKEKEKIKKSKSELKSNLELIKEKIRLLSFNAKQVDFVTNIQDVTQIDNKLKIGEMIIKETINFEKLYVFNFKELEISKSFTYPSRLFEIQDNGTYVVGGFVTSTQKFHLLIYDPIKKLKTHEVIFDKRIDELLTFKNKIVISQRITGIYGRVVGHLLKIMDENLILIRERNTCSILKSIDESHLYTISLDIGFKLTLFDWNLNEINANVLFQAKDSKRSFYFDSRFHIRYSLNQVVKRDNKYLLFLKFEGNHPDELYVYSEFGVLLNKSVIFGEFVIDSNNNIIVNIKKNDLIEFYDLNGDLFKTVSYKRPKNEQRQINQIKIDSADNIYFGQ